MRNYIGYVVCDLDGCLTDDRWRRHLLPKNGKVGAVDYAAYHMQCGADDPVDSVLNEILYTAFDEDSQRSLILFVTARPEEVREKTDWWLKAAVEPKAAGLEYVLLMRPQRDKSRSPALKMRLLNEYFAGIHGNVAEGWARVVAAYDDRTDVLDAYPINDDRKCMRFLPMPTPVQEEPDNSVSGIFTEMAATFAERNAVYGDNYLRVAPIIKLLWPEGVPAELVTEDRWHLFELMVVKMTRFAISDLTHIDSIHDAAVYAAMIESDIRRNS